MRTDFPVIVHVWFYFNLITGGILLLAGALESGGPGLLMLLPLYFVLMVAYMLPAVIAHQRYHQQAMAIFILNFFLGWTFIGWIAALIWACTRVDPYYAVEKQIAASMRIQRARAREASFR